MYCSPQQRSCRSYSCAVFAAVSLKLQTPKPEMYTLPGDLSDSMRDHVRESLWSEPDVAAVYKHKPTVSETAHPGNHNHTTTTANANSATGPLVRRGDTHLHITVREPCENTRENLANSLCSVCFLHTGEALVIQKSSVHTKLLFDRHLKCSSQKRGTLLIASQGINLQISFSAQEAKCL